jgi:hypothetical protein
MICRYKAQVKAAFLGPRPEISSDSTTNSPGFHFLRRKIKGLSWVQYTLEAQVTHYVTKRMLGVHQELTVTNKQKKKNWVHRNENCLVAFLGMCECVHMCVCVCACGDWMEPRVSHKLSKCSITEPHPHFPRNNLFY